MTHASIAPVRRATLLAGIGLATVGVLVVGAAPAYAADDSVSYLAPEYQAGELTGDGKVDADDLAILMTAVGMTSDDADWETVAAADADGDGVITVLDVAALSKAYLYDDDPFEILETDVVDIQKAMTAGVLTSEQLTAEYLSRIAAYDRVAGIDPATPAEMLEAIVATNPNAMTEAKALDAERAATGPRSILHGIPVLVKDNINTVNMATTAGCACLADNVTSTDAETVERLKAMGAIVIAKANLSEFAQSTASSISKYGTTRNAYGLGRDPGGSSGGTGASVSANLGVFGLGTDTGGSVRVPSSFNALVGIRPTIGLVSREGVIPLDLYRDTVGPMARSVSDAALALDALAGSDPMDAVTAGADGVKPLSYAQALDPKALEGKRIGYISGLVSGNQNAVGFRLVRGAFADLEAAGATVIDVGSFGTVNGYGLGSLPGSSSFTHDMNEYLNAYYRPGYTFADLAQRVTDAATSGGPTLSTWSAATVRGWASTSDATRDAAYPNFSRTQQAMRDRVDQLMAQYDLDAVIYPSTGGTVGSPASNNRISAFSGYPAVSVPMGFADSTLDETSYSGFPMGLEFLAEPYSESKLIGFAYAYEQQTQHRRPTTLFPDLAG
ncbi:amidase [Microbacterium sp. SORGH_AS428]|uniref:amidase family protein n=1 Tax=Microbacterium sp. SORGH_AS_0428 TaxID=3041788 RepID=UPI0028641A5C|nr:amidase family protein [Microbacterium sp. SORGH_AS_0428]MDR6199319.1 amidase [Microbacterium sp. SORGH_AS_0428]